MIDTERDCKPLTPTYKDSSLHNFLFCVLSQLHLLWSHSIRSDGVLRPALTSQHPSVSTGKGWGCSFLGSVPAECNWFHSQFEFPHWHPSQESLILAICLQFPNLPTVTSSTRSKEFSVPSAGTWAPPVPCLTHSGWWKPEIFPEALSHCSMAVLSHYFTIMMEAAKCHSSPGLLQLTNPLLV